MVCENFNLLSEIVLKMNSNSLIFFIFLLLMNF